MKNQRITGLAAVALSSALAMAACSSGSTTSSDTAAGGEEPADTSVASGPNDGDGDSATGCDGAEIAYITPGLNVPFWRSLSAGVKREAEAAGATVTDFDSKNSNSTQFQNAQDAITAGASAIIISPTDSASAPAVLELAAEAEVPVFIADIGTDEGEFVSFIKTDNVAGAADAGTYLVEQLNAKGITSGEIGMIGISQTRQNGKDRTQGFSDVVTEAGFTILPLLESNDYTRSEGLRFGQDLIVGSPEMVGMFSQHDEASQGAITAIEGADASDIVLVGFDGSPDTFQSITDKKMAGAAMQQPVLMGQEAFKAACTHLGGGTPEKEVIVNTVLVTQDNVDDVKAEVEDKVFAEE